VLDKNPKHSFDEIYVKIQNEFSDKNPSIILCSNPFIKTEFLNNLINSFNVPVIFVDFDLLYSGYVISGMIKKNENVKILRSNKIDFEKHLKEVIEKISKEQALVIFDSFNVLYNMFEDLDSFRFINASIMLLSAIAKNTRSQIVVSATAIKNENGEWVLSPGGKHLIDSKKSGIYFLNVSDSNMILNSINKKLENEKSFVIKK